MVRYFAYGSNMNPKQMRNRCPDAVRIGVGRLRGWTLKERLYADIEPKRGATVDGVVYELTNRDWAALDRFEGVPNVYMARALPVWVEGAGWHYCVAYMLTPHARRAREGLVYPPEYRARCSAGAWANGIRDGFKSNRRAG